MVESHSAVLAARTFLGLEADAWTAIGVWVTMAVYSVLAVLAFRQLREARTLRRDHVRPYVIVDISFNSFLMQISVKNIGSTAARDLTVEFDNELSSANKESDWTLSTLFEDGMPLLAPGRELLFNFDSYLERMEAKLPMKLTGHAVYFGLGEKESYRESFIIDLGAFMGMSLDGKGIPDIVNELERINKQLGKWSDGPRGLKVSGIG